MKEMQMRRIIVAALVVATVAVAQPKPLGSSTTVAGGYNWGSNWWTPFQWYRYAQCGLRTTFTRSLARPTYLNAILCCSQAKPETSRFTVYISTSDMLNVPQDSWVYADGWWANWSAMTGGHQVGTATADNDWVLVSWNIDSWINANPAANYFVVLDQMGDNHDAIAMQVWLGPRGEVSALEKTPEVTPNSGVSAAASPNPYAKATFIRYLLPKNEHVTARVYDTRGTLIRTLLAGTHQDVGSHCLMWDGTDNARQRVQSGTYYYRIDAGNQVVQGKLVLQD